MSTTDVTVPSGAMLIGDRWVAGDDASRRDHLNPATGKPLGSFALASPDDIDHAVAAARAAFPAWRDLAPAVRRDLLLELAR